MLEKLLHWDRELLLAINGANAPWLDQVMIVISWKHSYLIYLIVLAIIYKRSTLKQAGIVVLGAAITYVLDDNISTRVFKNNFERLRPSHDPSLEGLLNLPDGAHGQFGFISSHAANHFGLAMFFALVFHRYYPKAFPWFFIFPIVVVYSRVYLGLHFPGDVICGGLLGILVGWITFRVINRWLFPVQ